MTSFKISKVINPSDQMVFQWHFFKLVGGFSNLILWLCFLCFFAIG